MEFSNKKKIGIITLAALAGISIIGSSVAYFTSTDTKNNPFTVGSVRTILHEVDGMISQILIITASRT